MDSFNSLLHTYFNFQKLSTPFKLLAYHNHQEISALFSKERTPQFYEDKLPLQVFNPWPDDLVNLEYFFRKYLDNPADKHHKHRDIFVAYIQSSSLPQKIAPGVVAWLSVQALEASKPQAKRIVGLLRQLLEGEQTTALYETFILNYIYQNKKFDKIDMALMLDLVRPQSVAALAVMLPEAEFQTPLEEQNYFEVRDELREGYRNYFYAVSADKIERCQAIFSIEKPKQYLRLIAYEQTLLTPTLSRLREGIGFLELHSLAEILSEKIELEIDSIDKALHVFHSGLDIAQHNSQEKIKALQRDAGERKVLDYIAQIINVHFYQTEKNKTNNPDFFEAYWPQINKKILEDLYTFTVNLGIEQPKIVNTILQVFDKNQRSMSNPEAIKNAQNARALASTFSEQILLEQSIAIAPLQEAQPEKRFKI